MPQEFYTLFSKAAEHAYALLWRLGVLTTEGEESE